MKISRYFWPFSGDGLAVDVNRGTSERGISVGLSENKRTGGG